MVRAWGVKDTEVLGLTSGFLPWAATVARMIKSPEIGNNEGGVRFGEKFLYQRF